MAVFYANGMPFAFLINKFGDGTCADLIIKRKAKKPSDEISLTHDKTPFYL